MGVARRGEKGPGLPKFLENIVILCFESRFSKQNSVIRLKSNILPPPNIGSHPNSWSGYATAYIAYHPRGQTLINLSFL